MNLIKDMWKMAINCLGSNKVQGGQISAKKICERRKNEIAKKQCISPCISFV